MAHERVLVRSRLQEVGLDRYPLMCHRLQRFRSSGVADGLCPLPYGGNRTRLEAYTDTFHFIHVETVGSDRE